ncbi:MAG: 3-methyl-2-oxobutanoate hydroxymethyltransferase [Planctomycetota bacterium]
MSTPPISKTENRRKVTLRTVAKMAQKGERFACLTCYDATTATWLDEAEVPVLLVGDTAAEIVLGFDSTIHMPLDIAVALTAAVRRGAPHTLVMADMPFMSYQAGEDEAIRNAGRFMTEGHADIVKLEADASFAPLVARMTRAGVPICGHVGAKPQQVGLTGGYASRGKTAAEAQQIVTDAIALEQAGASMLLVEAVPEEVAQALVDATSVPVIGIGTGNACHGEILVLQDLLGLTRWQPKFAEPVASLGPQIIEASRRWIEKVRNGHSSSHRFRMREGEADKLTHNSSC